MNIIKSLKENCGFNTTYYAGDTIDDTSKFSPNDAAVMKDVEALKESKYFILIYPKKLPSSVLFEAGIALALGKNCIYFVKKRTDLPFLMRQAEQAFSNIKLYEYKTEDAVKKVIENSTTFKF